MEKWHTVLLRNLFWNFVCAVFGSVCILQCVFHQIFICRLIEQRHIILMFFVNIWLVYVTLHIDATLSFVYLWLCLQCHTLSWLNHWTWHMGLILGVWLGERSAVSLVGYVRTTLTEDRTLQWREFVIFTNFYMHMHKHIIVIPDQLLLLNHWIFTQRFIVWWLGKFLEQSCELIRADQSYCNGIFCFPH